MPTFIDRIPDLMDRSIPGRGRLLLTAGAVLLVVSIFLPLWQIHLVAPQYPEGLDLYIHSYKLEAGNEGQDLSEINNLNHYIGMAPIEEEDFAEMTFIPFLLGGFALLALRAAFFGTVKSVVDTLVLFVYFGMFSIWRFYYQLYTYAHNLDPRAPMDIDPFTPILIGWKQIANFKQYSFPREGSALLLAAVVCFAAAIWMGVRTTDDVDASEDEPEPDTATT
jgi:copper chaperone NosL